MPIEIDEFNKGKHDQEVQKEILDFLRANRTNAFTVEEILEGIGHLKSTDDLPLMLMQSISYSIILGQLVKDRRIKSKIIDYKNYYMIQ
ncbi:MAG: hypothetical protein JSW00_08835 [Thermoplasmata archaeon]|nr:MAG: hypothetical protein JSW00_08835 [Thermoplasmata archaeon]